MKNIDVATQITVELVRALVVEMQSMSQSWKQAFIRFEYRDNVTATKGSYETEHGVFMLDAMKVRPLFALMATRGPELIDATSQIGKRPCVFLLVVDSKLSYEIQYEWQDLSRWPISKMDGASGLPVGFRRS